MEYSKIIQANVDSLPKDIKWWARFAFHYTDLSNAISILQTDKLYSRHKVEEEHLMRNDNASYQVINMTNSQAQSYVRFYFRPLTPTQYYNEGYKHPQLRYDLGQNANVPIPIFFAFDLEKLIQDPKVQFSALGQAGKGSKIESGIDAFANLPFDKIYSDGFVDDEIRKYRHAELLYPSSYAIGDALEAILCRNEFEQSMLLTMLRNVNLSLFYKYKSKIKVCRDKMFEKNGLFLQDIHLNGDNVVITFVDNYAKKQYIQRMMSVYQIEAIDPIDIVISFDWKNSKGTICKDSASCKFDYANSTGIRCIIHNVKASILAIKVECGESLIGYKEFMLNNIF